MTYQPRDRSPARIRLLTITSFTHTTGGLALLMAVLLAALTGCQPKHYRIQADNEVKRLVYEDVTDVESPLNDLNVYANPTSRMFDPNPPDFEPMPPDDPRSHSYMHMVDGKRGYKHWDRFGHTPYTENPEWTMYLCPEEDGTIPIDIRGAVALSLNNSRLYQSRLEDLYLSALDVSFERFRFDAQFFGGYQTFFTADGPDRPGGPRSELDLATRDIRMSKLYASGGELVVGFANRLLWQFSGDDTHTATTLLDFSLIQPLLKSRGRLRVLESLTDTERALLAEVRQMERFRRGFYADIVSGLDPDSISGGGVGIGAAGAGGFLGLLQDTQEIRNQQASVTGLRDSLFQLEAAHEADRIDRFQVDLARQALYAAQSRLISQKAAYQARLDTFKLELGLPPEAPIVINDPLLNRFNLLDPALLELQEQVGDVLDELRQWEEEPPADQWQTFLASAQDFAARSTEHVRIVEEDMVALDQAVPQRRRNLLRLASRVAQAGSDIDTSAYDPDDLDERVQRLKDELQRFYGRVDSLLPTLTEIKQPTQYRELVTWYVTLAGELQELMLIQAGARLDTVTLQPVEINSYEALQVARCNRRDWQNERAALTDAWRQVQFTAADLTSFLNLVFEGDIRNTGDNPIRLQGTTGRLRVGAEFDAPLTRLAERNRYRAAQIAYQRARRAYYQYEDLVSLGLRNTLRNAELREVDFELRRAAVQVAISQVELTQLRLSEPPRIGAKETFNSTTARDLVTAIGSLLDAQNDFLGVWINYEVLRLGLDFNLGTMRLDADGIWIDPGVISVDSLPPCEDCIPEAPRAFDLPQYAVPESARRDENAESERVFEGEEIEPGTSEFILPPQEWQSAPLPEGGEEVLPEHLPGEVEQERPRIRQPIQDRIEAAQNLPVVPVSWQQALRSTSYDWREPAANPPAVTAPWPTGIDSPRRATEAVAEEKPVAAPSNSDRPASNLPTSNPPTSNPPVQKPKESPPILRLQLHGDGAKALNSSERPVPFSSDNPRVLRLKIGADPRSEANRSSQATTTASGPL